MHPTLFRVLRLACLPVCLIVAIFLGPTSAVFHVEKRPALPPSARLACVDGGMVAKYAKLGIGCSSPPFLGLRRRSAPLCTISVRRPSILSGTTSNIYLRGHAPSPNAQSKLCARQPPIPSYKETGPRHSKHQPPTAAHTQTPTGPSRPHAAPRSPQSANGPAL